MFDITVKQMFKISTNCIENYSEYSIQKLIALCTHIQHFKLTNIYTIYENTIFRGT